MEDAPLASPVVLKLVLPKGSLEKATMALFESADLHVNRSSSVNYSASIDDPRIDSVRILRPQEIPSYVADGLFDLGITGRDWVEETGSDVVSLGELRYSKATSKPIRVVLAVPQDSPWKAPEDLPAGDVPVAEGAVALDTAAPAAPAEAVARRCSAAHPRPLRASRVPLREPGQGRVVGRPWADRCRARDP